MTALPIKAQKDENEIIKYGCRTHTSVKRTVKAPVEDKAHELKVECAGKTLELDPTGGVLFTLTAFTEITIITVQLFLLKTEGNT